MGQPTFEGQKIIRPVHGAPLYLVGEALDLVADRRLLVDRLAQLAVLRRLGRSESFGENRGPDI